MRVEQASQTITRVAGALSVLRARQWVHFIVLPAAALDRAALSSSSFPRAITRLAIAAGASALALGYAYGINAVADRGSDEASGKNPLAGAASVPAEVFFVVAAAAVFALAASLLLGPYALALTVASLTAATLYSVGPRMKSLPILGLVFNTGIFAPLLGIAIADADHAAPPAYGVLASTFIALILQNQLLHESADAREDARGGVLTTARLLGPRGTKFAVLSVAVPGVTLAFALAPAPLVAWTAITALALGAAPALTASSPARARIAHRWIATAGGAAVFAAGLLS